MPKSRAMLLLEDDLIDYRHDWDFSNDQDKVERSATKQKASNSSKKGLKPTTIHSLPLEILEIIFSYCDPAALRVVVACVCQRWNQASRCHLKPALVWRAKASDQDEDPQQFLEKMTGSSQLRIIIQQGLTLDCAIGDDIWFSWERFQNAIIEPKQGGGRCALRQIQILEIFSGPFPSDPISPLMDHLRHLCHLKLHYARGTISLSLILDRCVSLRELFIRGWGLAPVEITVEEPSIARETTSFTNNISRSVFNLSAFTAQTSIVQETVVLWLINRCPDLVQLTLSDINQDVLSNGVWIQHRLNLPAIYALAGQRCQRLREMEVTQSTQSTQKPFNCYRDNRYNEPCQRHEQCRQRVPIWILQQHTPKVTTMTLTAFDCSPTYRWEPDRIARMAFHRLTHLFIADGSLGHRTLDYVLRCAPSLVHLSAPWLCMNYFYAHGLKKERWYNLYNKPSMTQRQAKRQIKDRDKQRRLIARGILEDYPMSNDWQCSELRSLEFAPPTPDSARKSDRMLLFYKHLVRHCPKITRLTLRFQHLELGQRVLQAYNSSFYLPDYPSPYGPKDSIKTSRKRATSPLELLRDLESLWSLKINTDTIPGVLVAEDLAYLRPPPLPKREMLSWEEEEVAPLLWPQLANFQVFYKNSPLVRSYTSVVEGLKEMRPEVHFEITRIVQHHPVLV